jgi:hypothetical protein
MKFKTLAATAALTLATGAACAADQSVGFTGSTASFSSGTSNVLQGGDDVITFTGLAAGTYDFLLTLSAQYVTLGSIHLNGVAGTVNPISSKITFASVEGVGQSPFTLTLAGSTSRSSAQYSGELSVTAVPEPESYALMLAGLGVLAFVARRRRTDA